MGGGSVSGLARGDVVRIWFDTGAMGVTLLWGVAERVGPKSFDVLWESGLRNRRIRFKEPRGVERELNKGVAALALETMRNRGLWPANGAPVLQGLEKIATGR